MSTPSLQTPQRGDVFWADLPPEESVGSEQNERRPVLVVSTNQMNDALREDGCVVVPLSRKTGKANRHFRILIPEAFKIQEPGTSGSKGDSVALTEQIRFIARDRMDAKRIAKVGPLAIAAVESGIRFVLGIP